MKYLYDEIRKIQIRNFGDGCSPSVYRTFFKNEHGKELKGSTLRKIKGFGEGSIKNPRKDDHDFNLFYKKLLKVEGKDELEKLFNERPGPYFKIPDVAKARFNDSEFFKAALIPKSAEFFIALLALKYKTISYEEFVFSNPIAAGLFIQKMTQYKYISTDKDHNISVDMEKLQKHSCNDVFGEEW